MQTIEGFVQRAGEMSQLRLDAIDRDPRREVAADHFARGAADAIDRRQRTADEPPPARERERERRRADGSNRSGQRPDFRADTGEIPSDENRHAGRGPHHDFTAPRARPGPGGSRHGHIELGIRPIDGMAGRVPEDVIEG